MKREFSDNIYNALKEAAKFIYNAAAFESSMFAASEFRKLIDASADVFKHAITSSVGNRLSEDLQTHLVNDVYQFSGFKTYAELKEISLLLRDENGNLISYERFEQKVLEINETYNVNYLKTEFRLARSSALMAARWEAFARDGDQYDLQYRTAGDDLVRESHRYLDKITLPFSDRFWLYFWPPNGFGCRCTVVQVRRGKYPSSDPAEAFKLGEEATEGPNEIFRYNPALCGKLFPPKHPYNSSACATCVDGSNAGSDEMCTWCAMVRSLI